MDALASVGTQGAGTGATTICRNRRRKFSWKQREPAIDSMLNDPALVEAARLGDQAALERLLKVCQPDLRRIAQAQCATSADADDAVQESMWLVYRRIGALRTVGSFSAWTFSIVRRECQRLMRRMRGMSELPDNDNAIFAYYTRPDLCLDLAAAIQSLPDKYREAIVLRDFDEYSITEIADSLRLTREAVKSRIHRGRQMIREYLQELGDDDDRPTDRRHQFVLQQRLMMNISIRA